MPAAYASAADHHDEMVDGGGVAREHWALVAENLREVGKPGLLARREETARLLEQDGAVYNSYGIAPSTGQPWRLDGVPTVISSEEWTHLEAGITERTEVLNLLLEDLYGRRELLRRGVLPPQVVYGHDGFLRACDGIRLNAKKQLFTTAADLGRDASGNWVVLSDGTQAPSGVGYALENRTVLSRILPDLFRDAAVHRLAPFFRTLRAALVAAAPPGVDDPRIVVLTPGPWNETAFEHALLSSTLGYPLVEPADLVVHDDGVKMRSLGRLEPVHVILRRVDGAYCDPLELRPDSHLGVPGLVDATRRGLVSVVNTLGSGAAENPALMRFLPDVAEQLLGSELQLPSVPSWWCGERGELSHVIANLNRLVLRPLSAKAGARSVFGSQCSQAQLDDLRRRVEHRPGLWVAQEPLPLSTTPTVTKDGLQPRRHVLRTFAVAVGESYSVMPGGLTRVAPDAGSGPISNQVGAITKDTWVLAPEPDHARGVTLTSGPAITALAPSALPGRAAENLWWIGRYAERAESVTRLLRTMHDRRSELVGRDEESAARLAVLRHALSELTGQPTDPTLTLNEELVGLLTDGGRTGTVAHSIGSLMESAFGVREQLSSDTWLLVGSLDRELLRLRELPSAGSSDIHDALQTVVQGLVALTGLVEGSMVRDLGWHFLDGGRRLERAIQLIALLQATLTGPQGSQGPSLVLESVLATSESLITYRRRYRSHWQLETVLELLLVDPGNPRSLGFQLDRLAEDLDAVPKSSHRLRPEQLLVHDAKSLLHRGDPHALLEADSAGHRSRLYGFLGEMRGTLLQAGAALEREQFTQRPLQRPLEQEHGR